MNVAEFITTPVGVVCVSVISSIVGTLIYKMGERIYIIATKKMKHKRFIKYIVSTGEMYCNGYTTAYAKYKSSFHQLLHVNMFTIKILNGILKIMFAAFLAIGLLFLFHEILIARPVIIAVASVYVTIQYQKIRKIYETYKIMFDHEFGDEYNKHMMEGVEKYWDSITKPKPEEHMDESNKPDL
jgi:uncharacterized membrane protein YqgA involved in biofilm formation